MLSSNTVAFVVVRQPKASSSNNVSFGCSSPNLKRCRQIPLLSLWLANPKTCHRTPVLLVVARQPWSVVVKYCRLRCGSPTRSLLVKHFFWLWLVTQSAVCKYQHFGVFTTCNWQILNTRSLTSGHCSVCLFCVAQVQTRVGLHYRRVCGLKASFITSIFGPGFFFLESNETF